MRERFWSAALLGIAACAAGDDGRPAKQPPRLTTELRLTMADGVAARTVQEVGLPLGLSQYFDSTGVLLWPGSPPVIGQQSILERLARTPGLDSTAAVWTPLYLRSDSGSPFGLALGTIAFSRKHADGRVTTELGRYYMAWEGDSAGMHLRVAAIGQARLPVLGNAILGQVGSEAVTSDALATTDSPTLGLGALGSADSAFRRAVSEDGLGAAFAAWLAPHGILFRGNGTMMLGPESARAELAPSDSTFDRQMRTERGAVSPSGELGWTGGEMLIRNRAAPDGHPVHWSYLLFWELQSGKYRIVAASSMRRDVPPTGDSPSGQN